MTSYTRYPARPASPGQRKFIADLLRDRDTAGTVYEGWTPDWNDMYASDVISDLKGLPYKATHRQQAEPGYYVRGDEAFKVQQNKAKTSTYALSWTGSSWEYAPGVGRTLADLTPMTAEDAAKIGLASGRCINCCRVLGGESLTSRVAAVVGYGEICATKNDWPFPKGAATQRVYLEG